jgi:hypothetical protein
MRVKTVGDRLAYTLRAMTHWVDRKKSILETKNRGAKIEFCERAGGQKERMKVEAQNPGALGARA